MSRHVTLCLAYYENPTMLALQVEALVKLPPRLREHVSLVVVDDGSPRRPARLPEPLPFEAHLYRMREDIPWNQDACRNLAAARAPGDWLLLTDMDHMPTPEVWAELISGKAFAGHAYTFRRVTAPDMTPYKPHPNSWFMTRELYDMTGGYDERFRGVYGTDGMFGRKVHEAADAVLELPVALVRYPREVVADASTDPNVLTRKSPENEERRRQIKEQLKHERPRKSVRGLTAWDRVQ